MCKIYCMFFNVPYFANKRSKQIFMEHGIEKERGNKKQTVKGKKVERKESLKRTYLLH